MSISFACFQCTTRLRIEESLGGSKVRCRNCEGVIIAPLESDRQDEKVEPRKVDAEAVAAILAGGASKGRSKKRSRVAIGVAIGIVLCAVGVLGWLALQTSSLPALVQELPDGDFFIYRTVKGGGFFQSEEIPFRETTEMVTLFRGRERMESVTIYRGTYSPESVEKRFREKGFVRETVDEKTIFDNSRTGTAVWISSKRIIVGQRKLVRDALRAREGNAPRFVDQLTHVQRRTLDRLPVQDILYFGKAPSLAERGHLTGFTRGVWRRVTSGDSGVGFALKVEPGGSGVWTGVLGARTQQDEEAARDAFRGLEEYLEKSSVECSDHVCVISGRITKLRLEIRENERAALDAFDRLARVQAEVRKADLDENGQADYWTGDVSGFYRLRVKGKPIRLIDPRIAGADLEPRPEGDEDGRFAKRLPRSPYHAYWFLSLETMADGNSYRLDLDGNQTKAHHPRRFAFCAVPAQPGMTGQYTFLVNQERKVYKKATDGAPVRRWPTDLLAEGWEEVP